MGWDIAPVDPEDVDELVALVRGYCDFYRVAPPDADLVALSRTLIGDDRSEGVQLLARDGNGLAVGFATVFWSWETLEAARIGVLNDLYVEPGTRGRGLAGQLIAACVDLCRARGDIASLHWQTAKDNLRAQAVYRRVGARRSEWIDFSLAIEP